VGEGILNDPRTQLTTCSIRNRLTALKRDTVDFVKPKDVINLYQATVKQGESCPTALVIYHLMDAQWTN